MHRNRNHSLQCLNGQNSEVEKNIGMTFVFCISLHGPYISL